MVGDDRVVQFTVRVRMEKQMVVVTVEASGLLLIKKLISDAGNGPATRKDIHGRQLVDFRRRIKRVHLSVSFLYFRYIFIKHFATFFPPFAHES